MGIKNILDVKLIFLFVYGELKVEVIVGIVFGLVIENLLVSSF